MENIQNWSRHVNKYFEDITINPHPIGDLISTYHFIFILLENINYIFMSIDITE